MVVKKYKNLVPLVLIVLMLVSTYSLVSTATGLNSEYKTALEKARNFSKQGIVVDAFEEYEKALDLKNTLDICLEVSEMYKNNEMLSDLQEWAEYTVEMYPGEPEAYEMLLNAYLQMQDYNDAFTLIEEIESRRVYNDNIKKAINEVEYKYDLGYTSYEDVSVFSEGYCAVKLDGLWGYTDKIGELEIAALYTSAGPFGSGKAAVNSQEEGIYYIDGDGNRKGVIPDKIDCKNAGIILDGFVTITDGTESGYYNEEFEHKFGEFDYAGTMNLGVAAIKEGTGWYLIDKNGKKINSSAYEDIALDDKEIAYRNERAFVKSAGSYIMVDSKGKQVGKESYEEAKVFNREGYAAVKKDGKWGFVDKKGKIVIEPQYEAARSFSNGLAGVCKDGKWGYIDENNEMKISNTFLDCRDFNENGCAFVNTEDDWVILKLYRYNHY